MSATEIAEKMVSENIEAASENEVNSSITASIRSSTSATIKKAFEIENKYYTCLIHMTYKKNCTLIFLC